MRTHRPESRAGLTLTRLLVVIAIISVLVAWFLPSVVRQACDAAGRSQFVSTLKQQAQAVANYVSSLGNQRRASPYLNHQDVGGFGQSSTGTGLGLPWQSQSSPYVDHDGL
jgi:competence protein ComGC